MGDRGMATFFYGSPPNAVYREDQWQRRSKHTELES